MIPEHLKPKRSQKQKLLERLQQGDWVSNGEIVFDMRITRASAIIYTLRKEGYDIQGRGSGSKFEYKLLDDTPSPKEEYSMFADMGLEEPDLKLLDIPIKKPEMEL